jgi:hypothetical protein
MRFMVIVKATPESEQQGALTHAIRGRFGGSETR